MSINYLRVNYFDTIFAICEGVDPFPSLSFGETLGFKGFFCTSSAIEALVPLLHNMEFTCPLVGWFDWQLNATFKNISVIFVTAHKYADSMKETVSWQDGLLLAMGRRNSQQLSILNKK